MMRHTGGVAAAATSTRSRLNCMASAMAFWVSMMPSWRPSGLMTRTWGDWIRMLRRMAAKGSLLRRLSRLYGGRPPGEGEDSAIQMSEIAGLVGRGAVFASNAGDDTTIISERKRWDQTLKLSPHEQLALALGLENLKPPATILDE